ncbi:hypothetical protein Droror1_Dr00026357 [Drosera rotundifolia]
MKLLPFLTSSDQPKSPPSSSSSWQWPACAHLETHSFRATTAEEGVESLTISKPCFDTMTTTSKMINMVTETTPVPSCFTTESSSKTTSTRSEEESGSDPIELVIRGLRSDRLFFEPEESNSILEEAKKSTTIAASDRGGGVLDLVPYKESVFLSMDSKDPFMDFRSSMLEMIEAHGLKDWEGLEELLGWYLKVNGKFNHGYIIGAFVDLLATLFSSNFVSSSMPESASSERTETTAMAAGSSSSSSFSCTCSPSSPLSLPSSSLTTPCLSSLDQVDEDDDENGEESSHRLVS